MFSPRLENSAFHFGNGEYAFPSSDVLLAISELENLGKAILGGEVYVLEGNVVHAMPHVQGLGPSLIHWETPSRQRRETWQQFVVRSAEFTRQAFRATQSDERSIQLPPGARIMYNLTWDEDT